MEVAAFSACKYANRNACMMPQTLSMSTSAPHTSLGAAHSCRPKVLGFCSGIKAGYLIA